MGVCVRAQACIHAVACVGVLVCISRFCALHPVCVYVVHCSVSLHYNVQLCVCVSVCSPKCNVHTHTDTHRNHVSASAVHVINVSGLHVGLYSMFLSVYEIVISFFVRVYVCMFYRILLCALYVCLWGEDRQVPI